MQGSRKGHYGILGPVLASLLYDEPRVQKHVCKPSMVPRYSGSWIRKNSAREQKSIWILAHPATDVFLRLQ